MIRPGMMLNIPYVVKPGETAISIASKFGISVAHLAQYNHMGFEIMLNGEFKDAEPEDAIPLEYLQECNLSIDPVTGIPYY